MEINEALDAIQTLVHCQGISRETEALETIRAALAVVQNSSHNKPSTPVCPYCYGRGLQNTGCTEFTTEPCYTCKGTGKPAHVG